MEGRGVFGVRNIDRKSSIENEPRTLSFDQIKYAREAALYVMNTRSMEEAVNIFTEGLEPVVNIGRGEGSLGKELKCIQSELPIPHDGIRDTVSAPF
ncbi:uncharacterized protein LOC126656599 [Mercurialis annua]|uniref:uncharacterized protein LOC126656599 n=1 Tax=Mercurialis annua TaxID=3986 RepID=UPI00215E1257|nr:uncharacterized protein LOC126656599 [Mercurialis annua]